MVVTALSLLIACQRGDLLPPDDVVWLRKPTGGEIAEIVPNTRFAYQGTFVIQCVIAPTGDLTACTAYSREEGTSAPTWAVELAAHFKAAPVSRSGLSTAGRTIRIPMAFTFAD